MYKTKSDLPCDLKSRCRYSFRRCQNRKACHTSHVTCRLAPNLVSLGLNFAFSFSALFYY